MPILGQDDPTPSSFLSTSLPENVATQSSLRQILNGVDKEVRREEHDREREREVVRNDQVVSLPSMSLSFNIYSHLVLIPLGGEWQCPLCSATLSRKAHVRRHVQSVHKRKFGWSLNPSRCNNINLIG